MAQHIRMESTELAKFPVLTVQADGTVKLHLLASDTSDGMTVETFADELDVPRALAALLQVPVAEAVQVYQDADEDFWDWVDNRRGYLDTFQTEEVTYRVDSTLRVRHLEDLLLKVQVLLARLTRLIPDAILIDLARSGQDDAAYQILKEVDHIRTYRKIHDRKPDPI